MIVLILLKEHAMQQLVSVLVRLDLLVAAVLVSK